MLQKVLITDPKMDTTTSLVLYKCGLWKYRDVNLNPQKRIEWKINGWAKPLNSKDHFEIMKISFVSHLQDEFRWSVDHEVNYVFDSFNTTSSFS